jgi:hypothetical protein
MSRASQNMLRNETNAAKMLPVKVEIHKVLSPTSLQSKSKRTSKEEHLSIEDDSFYRE